MNNLEIKKLPESRLEIKSSVSWENWKRYIDQAAEKLGKNIKIPGFRPGKAPRDVMEKQIGKYAILEEAAGTAIKKDYLKIVESEKLDVIGQPRAEILKLAEGNDLEYKIETALMPEVKITDYKNDVAKINREYRSKKIEVGNEEIDYELKRLAESRAKLITVVREARTGDSVVLDFQIFRDKVLVENGTGKNHPLILGKGVFIPGFEEKIIGMKENEEKEFKLVFPETYHEKNLAGKQANFKVKVNLVQERRLPEINDDFAKSLGKFENLEALKKSVGEGIKAEKERSQKEERRANIADALISKSNFDVPEILIHGELHKMIQEFSFQIEAMGMRFEDYVSKIGKSIESLEKEWRPQAVKRVKAALAFDQIAKEKKFEIPVDKIEEEMNKTLRYYKNTKDIEKNVAMEKLYNYTKSVLLNEEVFKYLEEL